jgi:hypothetical protein
LDTVGRIEEEMQLFASTFLGADGKELRKQSVDTVREYEEAMSAWEQLRDEGELCNSDTKSGRGRWSREELLQILDRTTAPARAARTRREESVEADWPQKILRQAIHVSCFAAEIRGLGYELLFGVSEAAGAGSGQFFQLILIRVSKNAKLDADFESVEKVIKKFPQKSY